MSTVPPPPPPPPAWPVGWPPMWTVALPPPPGANAALVTGIVAVAGGFVLLLPLLAGPLAWYLGSRAVREAERHPDRWRHPGRAGQVLGIVGTGLLAVVTLVAILVAILTIVSVTMPSPY